ncbi:hypothetical protein BKN38_01395 [Helicobacter sp. CLO-3]|uniref:NDR1/HIN1-like protein n=1 Tax=unclassified Helicobacter TaxID=2593540 RepID=UPI0008054DC9|nr:MULTISPECIES: LEA type 2 family protein [unclassified Helicobacter]OBV29765.1 hypothetical protein BA723_00200 [Helicobacter sp. CLO-3]OHU85218.1 hypothetical protein BKN38_01395 [Helicobacter sp. CLO-3]
MTHLPNSAKMTLSNSAAKIALPNSATALSSKQKAQKSARQIALIACLIAIALLFSACIKDTSTAKDIATKTLLPEAKIAGIKLESISLEGIDFAVQLSVKNPYNTPLSLDGVLISLSVQNSEVASSAIAQTFTLKASSSTTIAPKISIKPSALWASIKDYNSLKSLPIAIRARFKIPLPKIQSLDLSQTKMQDFFSFDESFSYDLPTFKPKFSVDTIDSESLKFSLKNESGAAFALEDVGYNLNINGKNLKGSAKVRQTSSDSVQIALPLKSLSENVLGFLLPSGGNAKNDISLQSSIKLGDIAYPVPLKLDFEF